jgi:hypothetical protein
MRAERLLLDSAILLVVGLVLLGIGWLAAPSIFAAAVDASGVQQLYFTRPTEMLEAYPAIALAIAIAAPLAWLVGLAYRGGARRPPHAAVLGGVVVALLAASALGIVRAVVWIRAMADEAQTLAPMLTAGSFELGASGIGMACRAAVLLAVMAFVLGRRSRTD